MKTEYCHVCGSQSFKISQKYYTAEFFWRNYKIYMHSDNFYDPLPILNEPPTSKFNRNITSAIDTSSLSRATNASSYSALPKPVPHTASSSGSSSKGCIWFISIVGVLLIIGGVIYGISVKISTSMSPNQQVLYQENGSDNWKGWKVSSEWKVLNGVLRGDGNLSNYVAPTILTPYLISETADYAVEASIQVVNPYSGSFGISVRGNGGTVDNGWQGYWATFNGTDFGELDAIIQSNHTNAYIAKAAFDPGSRWHTYRVEVKGNNIRIFVDDNFIVQVSDPRFPAGDQVGLTSINTQINISSFKIIAI